MFVKMLVKILVLAVADDYRRSGGAVAVGADGGEVQGVDSGEADAGVGADGGGGAAGVEEHPVHVQAFEA